MDCEVYSRILKRVHFKKGLQRLALKERVSESLNFRDRNHQDQMLKKEDYHFLEHLPIVENERNKQRSKLILF